MLRAGNEVAVTGIQPIGAYRLNIRFSDGKVSDVDFEPFLRSSQHPDIRKFLNAERFAAYRIEWGNLVWGDYELCFPLESLYENAILGMRLQAVAESRAHYGTSTDATTPEQPE